MSRFEVNDEVPGFKHETTVHQYVLYLSNYK